MVAEKLAVLANEERSLTGDADRGGRDEPEHGVMPGQTAVVRRPGGQAPQRKRGKDDHDAERDGRPPGHAGPFHQPCRVGGTMKDRQGDVDLGTAISGLVVRRLREDWD